MYIDVPSNVAAKPPIIVAIHYCSGTAQAYYTRSPYAQLADEYGFIVIYPSSPYSGTCWDVASEAALTHNGGGDSNSIANMVAYALDKYSGDASQVFVTGSSSGAMLTNVMAATYPELFKAATAYSGVPAGCFVSTGQISAPAAGSTPAWNSTCAQRPSGCLTRILGICRRGDGPGLQRQATTFPDLPRFSGHNSLPRELPGDRQGVDWRVWLRRLQPRHQRVQQP